MIGDKKENLRKEIEKAKGKMARLEEIEEKLQQSIENQENNMNEKD